MNIIFECITGSKLYGLKLPDSDIDIRGVCYNPIESLLGNTKFEQFEDKQSDRVIYGLNKFIKLLLDGNPNITELLFINYDNIISHSGVWQDIVNNREKIISKNSYYKFRGFADSEKRRFERSLDKNTNEMDSKRAELIQRVGYDSKASSHYLRLITEICELLSNGRITFPLSNKDFLLDIKSGRYDYLAVLHYMYEYDYSLERIFKTSQLRDKPDYKFMNDWLIGTNYNYIRSNYENNLW